LKKEKIKVGTTFQDFWIRNPRLQNPNIKHKQIPKLRERKEHWKTFWDFVFLGFGVSKFNHITSQFPNFEKVRGCKTNSSGFQDLGFQMSTTTHNHP
jgi:hypothetical protein